MSKHIYISSLLNNLSSDLKKTQYIKLLFSKFCQDFSLVPCLGAELEFYIIPEKGYALPELFERFKNITPEKGKNQFEITFPATFNIEELINNINNTKLYLGRELERLGCQVNFNAKPFKHDYGSSTHFHINFYSLEFVLEAFKSQFHRKPKISLELMQVDTKNITHFLNENHNYFSDKNNIFLAACSCCHYMNDSFLIFAPTGNDYERFVPNMMAPTYISFGANNRSAAIRIPYSLPKRLEHRIGSSNTDPYLGVSAILQTLYLGMRYPDKITTYQNIYGNAHDNIYELNRLPTSLEEALKLYNPNFFYL